MVLCNFMPSVTGMDAQSHALQTVSGNIANINTVGYKSSETMFHTLLGSTSSRYGNSASQLQSSRVGVNSVGYYDRTNIMTQGAIASSGGYFDVALNNNGNAFFTVKDRYSGDVYYTRAGNFRLQLNDGKPYLVANNGMVVQGFLPNEDGSFGNTVGDMVIEYPDEIPTVPTSNIKITGNVPADSVADSSYGMMVYGPNNNGANMNMVFSKVENQNNLWTVNFNIDGATVTSEPVDVQFAADGKLVTPKNFNINITWDDGSTSSVNMDISNMTQYSGSSEIKNITQDGKPSGTFQYVSIGEEGVISARYSNDEFYNIGKLALSSFSAPNNLTSISGTLFAANEASGPASFLEDNKGYIVPQALEQSTADVETEFSKMVIIQRAYGLNTNAFTVADEMTQTVVDLKT